MRRCVLQEPGRLELIEAEIPTPGAGEVVVRVRAALTCGTDLKAFRRGHPKMPCPTPFGHEFAGEIAAVGEGVRGVREGDAVMAANTGPCGRCFFCRREQENLCETLMRDMVLGAYGQYLLLPERVVCCNLYRKPASLSFEQAALLEPLSSVCHGLTWLPAALEQVVILGTGPIALLWLLALGRSGQVRVSVAGRRPDRLAAALELGAEDAWALADLEDRAAHAEAGGFDAVIECTGQPEVWEQAFALARPGGTVVWFGGCAPGSEVRLDTYRLHYQGVRVGSPFHFRPRDVRAAYEMLAEGTAGFSRLIDARVGLEQVPGLFERMAAGLSPESDRIKTAVLPRDEDLQ